MSKKPPQKKTCFAARISEPNTNAHGVETKETYKQVLGWGVGEAVEVREEVACLTVVRVFTPEF